MTEVTSGVVAGTWHGLARSVSERYDVIGLVGGCLAAVRVRAVVIASLLRQCEPFSSTLNGRVRGLPWRRRWALTRWLVVRAALPLLVELLASEVVDV